MCEPTNEKVGDGSVRLRICSLEQCEGRCCYDGVYLLKGEEDMIRTVVAQNPAFFASLPADYIVDGSWGDGRVSGRKTNVRPFDYHAPDFPAHFNRTKCVFSGPDHRCLLQLYSVGQGEHKWRFKPKACWMFPLDEEEGRIKPPPAAHEVDPYCVSEQYPGYVKFVPCGQDRPDGAPWREALSEEIRYREQQEAASDEQ